MNSALQRLVDRRGEFLIYLRQKGATEAQAEDLLHAALTRQLESQATLPSEERLIAWFYRVLKNAYIDALRRAGAAERRLAALAHEPLPADEARRPCTCTRALLATLTPEQARLIELVDLGTTSVAEAARALGISANNASVRLHRARRTLRTRLFATCGTCATEGQCADCDCPSSREL